MYVVDQEVQTHSDDSGKLLEQVKKFAGRHFIPDGKGLQYKFNHDMKLSPKELKRRPDVNYEWNDKKVDGETFGKSVKIAKCDSAKEFDDNINWLDKARKLKATGAKESTTVSMKFSNQAEI